MRRALSLVAVTMLVACGKSNDTANASEVCTGDVTITSSDAVNAFTARGCTSITGSLTIAGTELTSVNLPALKTVSGDIVIGVDTTLTSLSLPALTTVGGSLNVLGNSALTGLSLPALTTIGDDLHVSINTTLTSFNLPVLTTLGGSIEFSGNRTLTSFSLPVLTSVGNLYVGNNTALTNFSFPVLTAVRYNLVVGGTTALTSFSLPVLTTVAGDLFVSDTAALTSFNFPALTTVGSGLNVDRNTDLTGFSLPVLTTVGGFSIVSNAALTGLSFPGLTNAGGGLYVTDNPVLPQCLALGFKDHLVAVHGWAGTWSISDNDTTATCPVTGVLDRKAFVAKGSVAFRPAIETCTHLGTTSPVLMRVVHLDASFESEYLQSNICDSKASTRVVEVFIWSFEALGDIAPGTYPQQDNASGGQVVLWVKSDASCKTLGEQVLSLSGSVVIETNDATHMVGSLDVTFPGGDWLSGRFDAPVAASPINASGVFCVAGFAPGPRCGSSGCV